MLGIAQKAAGLSIEQTGIRYVRLKTKTWEIDKTFFLPLPPGVMEENQIADSDTLLEQLREAVKQERLKGTEVSLSVPPSQMIIRKMSIPSTNPKQVEQLIRLEVETGLHLPFENPVYDYVQTGTDEEKTHLLVFAAPRQTMLDYVQVVEEAGLKVTGVEISGMALARITALGHRESFQGTMLVHFEKSLLDVYMFHEGNPVFMRTLNLQDLNANTSWQESAAASAVLSDKADSGTELLSPIQTAEINAEISRMLNFYQYSLHEGEARIQEILITGPAAIRQQLEQELRQPLPEVSIREVDFNNLNRPFTGSEEYNTYRIAAGAALRPKQGEQVNLLPREDREAVIFPFLAVSLLGMWIIGVLVTGTFFVLNQGQISNQEERLQAVRDQRETAEMELIALSRSGLGQNEREEAIAQIRDHRESPVTILSALTAQLPEGSVLRDIGYTYRSETDMTVYFPKMEQSAEYLVNLRRLPFANHAMINKLTEGITDNTVQVGGQSYYTAVYRILQGQGGNINMQSEEEENNGAVE